MSTSNEHSGTSVQPCAAVTVHQRPQAASVETIVESHVSNSSQKQALRRPLIYAAAIQPSQTSWPRIFPPL
jgi:hypothetical protein